MANLSRAERELSEFVQSCVNFRTNVQFTDIETYRKERASGPSSPFAVLIGTREQLEDDSVKGLPVYCPAVAEAIARVKEGKTFGVLVEGVRSVADAKFVRVVVGEVPSKASRTNCPARPDVIAALMTAALEEAPEEVAVVDVFVRSTAAVAVAVAVARSGRHNFSAKNGLAGRAYQHGGPQLHVVFPAPPTPPPQELSVIATSTQLCQRLVDAPTNLLNTTTFTEVVQSYAKELGCDIDVICGDELCERGYGGMYSVGKAAREPPRLVTLTYTPKSEEKKKIALVGKGIVYDCGGLALKYPATSMVGMKHDMGGAAAVFCGFVSAVRLGQPVALTCTLCLAENAIGSDAYRNDDIVVMRSGKTVEVNNTDAEGRLVVGDGVFHATNELPHVPDVLIDMATLTGAQGITTGRKHAGIFVNDEDAELAFLQAGKTSGETCFPVLYCPEYHIPEFQSTVADMRNLMEHTNNAGTSCGGQFIANHLSPKFTGKYVHVDLAYPTFDGKGATGFGAALLTEYIRSL